MLQLDTLRSITILKQSDGRWQWLCVHDTDGVIAQGADNPDVETAMEEIMKLTLNPDELKKAVAFTTHVESASPGIRRALKQSRRPKKRHRTS